MPSMSPRCRLFRAFVGCGFYLLGWEEGFSWIKYTQPSHSGVGLNKTEDEKWSPDIWVELILLFFSLIAQYSIWPSTSSASSVCSMSCVSHKDGGHWISATCQLKPRVGIIRDEPKRWGAPETPTNLNVFWKQMGLIWYAIWQYMGKLCIAVIEVLFCRCYVSMYFSKFMC